MAKQKIYKRFKVYTPTELRKILATIEGMTDHQVNHYINHKKYPELYTVERIKDIFDELTD